MDGNNNQNGTQYSYHAVMDVKSNNRGFAIASMVLGIVAIVCCCFYYVGLVAAVLAIVFSVISRVRMGYFDGFAVAGLIMGIIGLVFGVAILIVEVIFTEALNEYLATYYPEIYNQLAINLA